MQRLFAHTAAGDGALALWSFLASTGLRIGEALALRWADVELGGGCFLAREHLGRGPYRGRRVGDSKTETNTRR